MCSQCHIIYFCEKLQILSENNQLTGIILSGGKSSRMGQDKGFCELNKKPLITYSIDVLSPICNQILIGANSDNYAKLGYPVIKDEITNIGPIGGIYSCLKSSKTNDNIILSCDMPLVTAELIAYILSERDDYEVIIPVFKGFQEPLCAYYNKSITPGLLEAINANKYKIQDVIKGLKTKFITIEKSLPFYQENLFANMNSEQDLLRIESHLSKNSS